MDDKMAFYRECCFPNCTKSLWRKLLQWILGGSPQSPPPRSALCRVIFILCLCNEYDKHTSLMTFRWSLKFDTCRNSVESNHSIRQNNCWRYVVSSRATRWDRRKLYGSCGSKLETTIIWGSNSERWENVLFCDKNVYNQCWWSINLAINCSSICLRIAKRSFHKGKAYSCFSVRFRNI